MKKTAFILLSGLLLAACDKKEKDAESSGPQKGYLTGMVKDMQGKPIAGANILLDNSVFYASYIRGVSNTDGTYKIRIEPGAWKAYAHFKKEYNGQIYPLQLDVDNNISFNEEGAVRNFTWKLEGRRPGNDFDYYGGFIQLSPDVDFYEDFEDIALTLTPNGPLIDGSPGKTLKLNLGDHYWVDYYQIEDVPIGRYIVTAVWQSENGPVPLKIQNWHTKDEFASEFQLDFIPDDLDFFPRNEASIVIGN